MKKSLIFFTFFFITFSTFCQNKNIIIQFYFCKEDTQQVSTLAKDFYTTLKETQPFNEYAEKIKIGGQINTIKVSLDNYDELVYNQQELIKNHAQANAVDIYILNTKRTIAKGGTIKNIPVIFADHNIDAKTLLHELCHALVGLGDEYDEGIDITFSEKYVSKYPNLTLTKPNKIWEQIKSETKDNLMGYYVGGLGSSFGIYHSYPVCIMQNVSDKLCPICQYFTKQKLEELTK